MDTPTRLLLVDPDATFRTVVTAWLAERGWAVAAWGDGRAALAKFDEARPDVVLAALEGEDLDGLELIEAIVRRPGAPPVVLCSRHHAAANWDRASLDALGIDDVIVRPIAFPALAARLEAAVRRSRVPAPAPQVQPLAARSTDEDTLVTRAAAAGGETAVIEQREKRDPRGRRKRRRR